MTSDSLGHGFYTGQQVQAILGIKRTRLYQLYRLDQLPNTLKISSKIFLYTLEDVKNLLQSRSHKRNLSSSFIDNQKLPPPTKLNRCSVSDIQDIETGYDKLNTCSPTPSEKLNTCSVSDIQDIETGYDKLNTCSPDRKGQLKLSPEIEKTKRGKRISPDWYPRPDTVEKAHYAHPLFQHDPEYFINNFRNYFLQATVKPTSNDWDLRFLSLLPRADAPYHLKSLPSSRPQPKSTEPTQEIQRLLAAKQIRNIYNDEIIDTAELEIIPGSDGIYYKNQKIEERYYEPIN